jgi:tetratricopeptide (TPR) repeat protein
VEREALWLRVVLGVTALVYLPALWAAFLGDDLFLASAQRFDGVNNPMIADWQGIGGYFTAHYWKGTLAADGLYRPITILSYATVYHTLAGLLPEAVAQHAVNVLLHLLATFLVHRLAVRLGAGRLAAGLAALVFGLHAIHHEAVVVVVGRADLLSLGAGLGGVLVLLGARSPASLAGAGDLWFVAFCSKESSLAWPLFAPLCGACRDGWSSLRRHCLWSAAAATAPLVAFFALRHHALADLPEYGQVAYLSNPLYWCDDGTRVFTATWIWFLALCKTVVPYPLLIDYGPSTFELVSNPLAPRYLLAATVLLGLLGAALLAARRQTLLFLAVACFFGFSFLTSNVPFAIGTVFGERLLYVPSLAASLLVAWLAARARPRLVAVITIAWCALCAGLLVTRHLTFRSLADVVQAEIKKNPASIKMQIEMAGIEKDAGQLEAAVARMQQSVAQDPLVPLAQNNLAAMLMSRHEASGAGRPEQRRKDLADAEAALRLGLASPVLFEREEKFLLLWNLGRVLRLQARPAEAWEALQDSFQSNPEHLPTVLDMLDLAWEGRQTDDVIVALIESGAKIDRQHAAWPLYRGLLQLRARRPAAAEPHLREALQRWPAQAGNPWRAAGPLADALVAQGRHGEAIAVVRQALADPRLPQQLRAAIEERLRSIQGR